MKKPRVDTAADRQSQGSQDGQQLRHKACDAQTGSRGKIQAFEEFWTSVLLTGYSPCYHRWLCFLANRLLRNKKYITLGSSSFPWSLPPHKYHSSEPTVSYSSSVRNTTSDIPAQQYFEFHLINLKVEGIGIKIQGWLLFLKCKHTQLVVRSTIMAFMILTITQL